MKKLIPPAAALAALVLAFILFPGLFLLSDDELAHEGHDHEGGRWACPMLCVVVENPGLCPVCGMELEEIASSSVTVTLSAAERELTGLTLVEVEFRRLRNSVTLTGTVTEAETSRAVVTAWTSGRIDRFPSPSTGESIGSGSTVAWIYSPELIEAQHDLLYSLRAGEPGGSLQAGAEHRLRQLGAAPWIIAHVAETGEVMEALPVASRYSGTVTDRRVEAGDWVQTGQVILEIANLSDIWVEAELLEGQSALVTPGDSVAITAYSGGTVIPGTVTHLDPYFDPVTRGRTARIQAGSPETPLLPGELVRITLVNEAGGTPEPELAIPATSVLSMGSRHLVYALSSDSGTVHRATDIPSPLVGVSLVPVVVELGPLSRDEGGTRHFPVLSGLSGGEIIADHGAFLLDSQAELTGMPSLMNSP